MATTPRPFDRPDYENANAAIDQVLAQESMKQKGRVAKRQIRKAEHEYRMASRRVLARGELYEKAIANTNTMASTAKQASANAKAALARQQVLLERANEAAQSQASKWSTRFQKKYGDLSGAERNQAWQDFYQNKAKRTDAWKAYEQQTDLVKAMQQRATNVHSGYKTRRNVAERRRSYYKGGQRQAEAAYDAYQAAVRAYNATFRFVRWSP